ncbi:MAG: hypothetical protein AAFR04_09310 [Pseudomonadota bacterium]
MASSTYRDARAAEAGDGEGLSALTWAAWLLIGGSLFAAASFLAYHSHLFGYAYDLTQIPSLPLTIGLVTAGLIYIPLLYVIRRSIRESRHRRNAALLAFVVVMGFAMRGMLMTSEPALEDDYQRYLWDGAVLMHGLNPYAVSPEKAAEAPRYSTLHALAKASGKINERVNHRYLKTIYPPVAQGAFALAYAIKPWSLVAWRVVCLIGEAATLALMIALLTMVGRSPLWSALYWWNPVVIKELINATHMEAILLPLVLAAMMLAVRRWHLASTVALGFAVGAKLWPLILAPLIWRPLINHPIRLLACAFILTAMTVVWALPAYLGGLDDSSGFVAYAQNWKTNSALFPAVERAVTWVTTPFGLSKELAGLAARGLMAGLLGLFILWLARKPLEDGADLMQRASLVAMAMLIVSPAQYPWYATWMFVFLPFLPKLSMAAVTVFIPLYYTAFYLISEGKLEIYTEQVVWAIWLPIWALIAFDVWWAQTAWRRWQPDPLRA